MTTAADPRIVLRQPPSAPALRAADQGVADALEAVLSNNTRRVYGAQWRLFTGWCDLVGLRALPAEPLTVARYLAVRAGEIPHGDGGKRVRVVDAKPARMLGAGHPSYGGVDCPCSSLPQQTTRPSVLSPQAWPQPTVTC